MKTLYGIKIILKKSPLIECKVKSGKQEIASFNIRGFSNKLFGKPIKKNLLK